MELYSYPNNPRAWKARIAAEFSGVKLPASESAIQLDGKANKEESFLKINPFGQVPSLKLQDGQGVFESNSIARHIARLGESSGDKKTQLYGSNAAEASRIDGFLDAVLGLEATLGPWSYKAEGTSWSSRYREDFITDCIAQTKKTLLGFEEALKENSFIVGKSVTLADITWWCACYRGFKYCFDKQFLAAYPKSTAHFRKLEALPQFQAVVKGSVPALEKPTELKYSTPVPVRYHRIATISDGKQSIKFKIYSTNSAADVSEAIRARFNINPNQRVVLTDEEGCDVVVDGTLETAHYKLHVLG
jgi:elongation factor 1-gamma